MAEITLDGARVTLCALTIPRVGAWVADLDVDRAGVLRAADILEDLMREPGSARAERAAVEGAYG